MAKVQRLFLCRRTLRMDDAKTVCFEKDKVYRMSKPNCLIDEDKDEHFVDVPFLKKHFVEVMKVPVKK
jgi:hypothetical protein